MTLHIHISYSTIIQQNVNLSCSRRNTGQFSCLPVYLCNSFIWRTPCYVLVWIFFVIRSCKCSRITNSEAECRTVWLYNISISCIPYCDLERVKNVECELDLPHSCSCIVIVCNLLRIRLRCKYISIKLSSGHGWRLIAGIYALYSCVSCSIPVSFMNFNPIIIR